MQIHKYANWRPTWWLSKWKKFQLIKGGPSSTFLRQPLVDSLRRVITPKATISNISCSEFHLSRARLRVSDYDDNSFRLEKRGCSLLSCCLMLTWRWTEGDDDGACKKAMKIIMMAMIMTTTMMMMMMMMAGKRMHVLATRAPFAPGAPLQEMDEILCSTQQ